MVYICNYFFVKKTQFPFLVLKMNFHKNLLLFKTSNCIAKQIIIQLDVPTAQGPKTTRGCEADLPPWPRCLGEWTSVRRWVGGGAGAPWAGAGAGSADRMMIRSRRRYCREQERTSDGRLCVIREEEVERLEGGVRLVCSHRCGLLLLILLLQGGGGVPWDLRDLLQRHPRAAVRGKLWEEMSDYIQEQGSHRAGGAGGGAGGAVGGGGAGDVLPGAELQKTASVRMWREWSWKVQGGAGDCLQVGE